MLTINMIKYRRRILPKVVKIITLLCFILLSVAIFWGYKFIKGDMLNSISTIDLFLWSMVLCGIIVVIVLSLFDLVRNLVAVPVFKNYYDILQYEKNL